MAVAGLGDPALGAGRSRGVLGGHQAQIGADRPAAQSFPIPDLGSQPERRQRRDPAQAAQPTHYRGEHRIGGHRRDRVRRPAVSVPWRLRLQIDTRGGARS